MSSEEKVVRKLRAILSADVKGYSLLMANDEAYTIKKLEAYRDSMSELIRSHSGRVVDAVGDNLLAEFSSVVDAVQCSVKIQKDLQKKNADLPTDKRLEFRIGVNIGDVIQEGDRIYGNGVNVAARIEGLADAGGICISRNAYGQIRDKLELGYEYLGDHSVKNIKQPVRVYKVLMNPEDAGKLIGDVPKPGAKNWIWATVVLAVIVITAVAWQVYRDFTKPEYEPARIEEMAYPLPEIPSIAVLPFVNMSGDSSKEYVSDNITEQIITSLSKVPRVFVISRTSTFSYKGKPVKVQQVAEDLGVRYVLEGSVQQSGDKIRITAQLIDALTGRHIWAERYERNYKDIFALQDEITLRILNEIQVKLTSGESARLFHKKVPKLDAYEKVVEGVTYWSAFNSEGNAKARRLAQEAIDLDPEFSGGYRLMAAVHFMDVHLGLSKSPGNSLDQSLELLQKSIDLDENDSRAYSLLCHVYGIKRQFEKSIQAGQKAIEMNPNSDMALTNLAMTLRWIGKPEEAIALHHQAIRLCPFPPAHYYLNLGNAYRTAGRCEEAIEEYKKTLHLTPKNLMAFEGLSICYGLLGQENESRLAASEILKLKPNFTIKFMVSTNPYKDRQMVERWADVLRRAGIPEYPPGREPPEKPSIAVLAFDNLSGDPEQEYFSDGMTDDIITDLSKIKGLLVISRNSTFTYKGKEIKIPAIAKELGVKYVLEGSIRRDGDEVRINAQLIDAATDHHVWADRFDGNNKSIFALQDEITERIVSALAVELTASEKTEVEGKGTSNIAAYDNFLKGMSHLRKFTPKDYVKAIEYFETAIELDPNYSDAYANLATIYMKGLLIGEKFWKESGIDFPTARLLARYYVGKAMKKPTSRGYQVLAQLELYKRNFNEAVDYAEHAVAISPNDADAMEILGGILVRTGQPEEGLKYHKKSIMLDPLYKSTGGIGYAYYVMGEYEQAVKYIEKQLKDYPETYAIQGHLAGAYAFLGNDAKAKKAFKEFNT